MDITPICGSPWLIAACRVLHRLSVPRHSPCALYSLTCSSQSPLRSVSKHSLKTACASLLLTSNSDPLTLGSKFVSGAVPDHGRSQVYLQELGYLSVEVCFLTYPLAICSMIFRSYPNNILEKPYINLLYLSIKRNNI